MVREVVMNTDKNQEISPQVTVEAKNGSSYRNLKWLLILCLLVITGGVGLMLGPQLQASEMQEKSAPPAMPPMPVETAEVRIANSDKLLFAVGTLRSEESVVIAAEIPGRIKKIDFGEGEQSGRGHLLI